MKFAIVLMCAVASLCGPIEGRDLRNVGGRRPQVVESVTDPVLYDDSDNGINDVFSDATDEEQEEPSFGGSHGPTPANSVNRNRSTPRRTVDPEQVLADIQKKSPPTPRTSPQYPLSTRRTDPTPEPTPETTTEYKYKDLVEAYTKPQPKYIPMRHVAGTHYVKVDVGQDEYERVIEDYNRLFNHRSQPAHDDYSAPPKF